MIFFKTKGRGNNLVLVLQKILVLRSHRVLRYFPNFSHLQCYIFPASPFYMGTAADQALLWESAKVFLTFQILTKLGRGGGGGKHFPLVFLASSSSQHLGTAKQMTEKTSPCSCYHTTFALGVGCFPSQLPGLPTQRVGAASRGARGRWAQRCPDQAWGAGACHGIFLTKQMLRSINKHTGFGNWAPAKCRIHQLCSFVK